MRLCRVEPWTHSCWPDRKTKTGRDININPNFEILQFNYPDGPTVLVHMAQGCHPSVDSNSLQAKDATGAVALVTADLKAAGK